MTPCQCLSDVANICMHSNKVHKNECMIGMPCFFMYSFYFQNYYMDFDKLMYEIFSNNYQHDLILVFYMNFRTNYHLLRDGAFYKKLIHGT
jgi:hypothetical protein